MTLSVPAIAWSQQFADYSPNTRAAWYMPAWQPTLVLTHRFEVLAGGDELINIPLITIGTAVSDRLSIGLDFTSNSEVASRNLGGNETQWWVGFAPRTPLLRGVSTLLAYNTAARSADAAITLNRRIRRVSVLGEVRAFSVAWNTGESDAAVLGGAALHLTDHLRLIGDVAQPIRHDSLGVVWSAGLTLTLPGTRHAFSFHASNSAAPTLQGASRRKRIGEKPVRFGFTFVAPLGSGNQWAQVFGRGRERAGIRAADDSPTVSISALRFSPDTVRVRAGQIVRWVNADPVAHTVSAVDRRWSSGQIAPGAQFEQVFTEAGVFDYYCEPHPHMRGTVIVSP